MKPITARLIWMMALEQRRLSGSVSSCVARGRTATSRATGIPTRRLVTGHGTTTGNQGRRDFGDVSPIAAEPVWNRCERAETQPMPRQRPVDTSE